MAFILFIILPWLAAPSTAGNHAVYVSVLEIKQAPGAGAELSIKVFTDDLEDAVFNQSARRIDLQNGDCSRYHEEVARYFREHLQLVINGKTMAYDYLSCEINDISVWFTFHLQAPDSWSAINVKADYLMELFPTQNNIVSITYHGHKRMFRLRKGATKAVVSF